MDADPLAAACPALPQHRNGYQEFVDLFMVITVGIATVVVLFRVAFTVFPVALGNAVAAPALPSPPAGTGRAARNGRTRTAAGSASGLTASTNALATAPTNAKAAGSSLKRHASVKERLEAEIRALLPRRSTYYALPFVSDSIVSKTEFVESLLALGDDALDGWLLVKKGAQRTRHWKKRYVVLDANGRIKYYANADAARRGINIKGSLAVYAVKPADPLEFGVNTLEVRGTLGGTYFFRADDDMGARKWLCVLTKRAIQSRVPGRIDSQLSSAVLSKDSSNSPDTVDNGAGFNGLGLSGPDPAALVPRLKTHSLDVHISDMAYTKESSLRQFYVVVKFRSELHDHAHVAVGQSAPRPIEKGGVVTWNEPLAWTFTDHACAECTECQAVGSTTGTFCGLPDIMVLHVYEIHLRYLTTKIGETAVALRELFGFVGMQHATLACAWPVTSPADAVLGQLGLKLTYTVNSAPGAALTPFLVSSEAERELIGEFAIHPSVTRARDWFDLFYATGQAHKWSEYYRVRGDSEFECGDWTVSKEFGGQVRVLSCRSLTNASIGPSSTMNTTTQHVLFGPDSEGTDGEGSDGDGTDRFVLEAKVFLHDIPYGDCFNVETVTVIERSGATGPLLGKVYLGIPFSKGCMFKSKIISATREGVVSSTKLLFELLNKTLDDGRSAGSTTPTTPFLVSKEDERSPLGEYDIHPSVTDAIHFFDLYFATGAHVRWDGYYRAGGDTEHEYSDWTDAPPDVGGQVRTIKYRAQSNSSLGPPSTTATQTQHVNFSASREDADPNRVVIEIKMALHDVPYGDSFTVETVYEISRDATDNRLVARAFLGVPFSKSTMFKSKIASATKDGVVKSTKLLFDELRKALDTDSSSSGSGISGPGTEVSAAANGAQSRGADTTVTGGTTTNSTNQQRRPVLARYNSYLDGSVALEEIFENQRVSIFGKWGPNHLLPTDRERFTNRNGDVELSFETITLPPHWIWTSPWKIDKNYTECDDEGWSYATDFPRFKLHLARGKSSMKRLGASVRRRRWIRMMCYVPPEGPAASSVGTAAGSAPSQT